MENRLAGAEPFGRALREGCKRLHRWGGAWVRALAAVVFPGRCLGCGELHDGGAGAVPASEAAGEVSELFARWLGACFCPFCRDRFEAADSPLCPECGAVFAGREGEDHTCGECLAEPKPFRRARAAGVYRGPLMAAVHQLKYRGRLRLQKPLGSFLFEVFLRSFDPRSIDLIVPVPLHVRKQRRRGFNQAHLLVRRWEELAAARGLDWGGCRVAPGLLVRRKATAAQTGLGKRARRANVRRAFVVRDPAAVRDKSVLLVDDVYTTGATACACTEALVRAGAGQVEVLTLARAL